MVSRTAKLEAIFTRMRHGIGSRSGVFVDLPYLEFDNHIRNVCDREGLDESGVRQAILQETYRQVVPEQENKDERLVRYRLWSRMIEQTGFHKGVVYSSNVLPKGSKAELQRCFDEIIKPSWPEAMSIFETKGSRRFAIQVVSSIHEFFLDYQIYGSLGINGGYIYFTLAVYDQDKVFLRQTNLDNLYLDYKSARPSVLSDVTRRISKCALMIDYTNRHFRSVA